MRDAPTCRGYLVAAILGALGGGLLALVATRAIPKAMSRMMRSMMEEMRRSGCDPADM